MPTVLQAEGFYIKIRLNDHEPAHVHVTKSGGEAVIRLDPVVIQRIWNLNKQDASRAKRIIEANQENLLKAWRSIHGDK